MPISVIIPALNEAANLQTCIQCARRGYRPSEVGIAVVDGGEIHLWENDTAYRKIRVVDGRLAGAVLMGNRADMMAIYKAIGLPVAEYGGGIIQPSFPWNDLTGADWDYLFY